MSLDKESHASDKIDTLSNTTSWTKADDEQLLLLVEVLGQSSWSEVATMFDQMRTPRECQERHQNLLSPPVEHEWTATDDEKLMELYNEHGNKWQVIAEEFGGSHTYQIIKQRIQQSLVSKEKKTLTI